MQNPFVYPTVKVVRRYDPRPGKPYANYRTYKPALRQEFGRRCVYCRKHDVEAEPEGFHIDHYRPVVRFPQLERDYENLFYACAACNQYKGDWWLERGGRGLLPNPCDFVMADHLRYRGPRVTPQTTEGEIAVDVLDLNNDVRVDWRAGIITAVSALHAELKHYSKLLKATEKKKRQSRDKDETARLTQAAKAIRRKADAAKKSLDQLFAVKI